MSACLRNSAISLTSNYLSDNCFKFSYPVKCLDLKYIINEFKKHGSYILWKQVILQLSARYRFKVCTFLYFYITTPRTLYCSTQIFIQQVNEQLKYLLSGTVFRL